MLPFVPMTRSVRDALAPWLAVNLRDAVVRKAHDDARRRVDVTKRLFRAHGLHREDRERLGLEDVARRVDAVDAHVEQRAATDVAIVDWARHERREDARLDRLEVRREMETVGDHQLHARVLARFDHRLAVLGGRGHRPFAQHVRARARHALRHLSVERARHGDVDGLHALVRDDVLELVVRAGRVDARHDPSVDRVLELRDATEPDDGPTDLVRFHPRSK